MSTRSPILCDLFDGRAHGRQAWIDPDPADPRRPAPVVLVRIAGAAEPGVATIEYLRQGFSDRTHRWVYRP